MVGDLTAMSSLMKPLLRLCDAIALMALAVLFGVVAVNVLGRALFDASGHAVNLMIPGANELSRYALICGKFGTDETRTARRAMTESW